MNREGLRKILRGKCVTDESCETAIDELLNLHSVSGCYECVVMYRDRQGDGELRQSHHKGETKDEALRDFFDKVGEKGINVLWLNNR